MNSCNGFPVVVAVQAADPITVLSRSVGKLWRRHCRPLAGPMIALIWVYQRSISPLLGPHCRFTPTCSLTELRHCGLEDKKAVADGETRIKCHPTPRGDDPVPPGPFDTREHSIDGFATRLLVIALLFVSFHDLASPGAG